MATPASGNDELHDKQAEWSVNLSGFRSGASKTPHIEKKMTEKKHCSMTLLIALTVSLPME